MPSSETLLHDIRQRINYTELFAEFLPSLRGRGAERMAFCPFHTNTDTPALSVNVEEGLFRCHNPECGASGDFITFYMRVRAITRFPEAVAELARRVGLSPDVQAGPRPEHDPVALRARNEELLRSYQPPAQGASAPEPTIDEQVVDAMHQRLLGTAAELAWLADRRGLTLETVERFKLGHDGQRYYIPIRDAEGAVVNIRRYRANARRAQDKMISWRPGFGQARLWPVDTMTQGTPADGPVFLLEGEMDTLLALQHGLRAITTTGGAGTWRNEWTPLFRDYDVVLCFDNDAAGRAGAHRVARALMTVAQRVRVLTWPYTEPAGFDLTDYFHGMGQTVEDFVALVQSTPLYRPPPEALTPPVQVGELPQRTLAEAGRAEYHNEEMRVPLTISGIASAPSIAPKEVQMFCGTHAGSYDMCDRCPLRPGEGNGIRDVTLEYVGNDVLDYVNVPDHVVLKNLKHAVGIPAKCTVVTERRRRSINLLEAQAIPDVGQGEGVSGSEEYVTRRVYQQVESSPFIRANHSYRATMATVNDPKTQSVVHVVRGAVPSQSDIDVFQMSDDAHERLAAFQPGDDRVESLWDKLEELHTDLERVARIYQRRDLLLAVDLTYMSPVGFWFQGERVVRGWVDMLVIGDSRTGKTTVVQRLLTHYRAGEFSSGENTSFAGLVGGLNDLNRSWFTRWGKVPLNDRRLLVIDEAGNLPQEQIARMSSMRSSGIAEIVKIHAERTNARTRQIWISNPRGNRPLSTYSQGTLAVRELIGAPEDIARFDIVVTAGAQDVTLATINAAREAEEPCTFTSELCHQRVMWAWSRKPEHIKFTPDAVGLLLRRATEQGERYRYATEVPLVEANEQRIKLARLATAAAATFFSTDEEGVNVIVRPQHVELVYEFLERLYAKPSLAFTEYARMQRRRFELQSSHEVAAILRRTGNAARALMEQESLTQTDLMEILGYNERSDLREALTKLRDAGFLRRVGSSFYVKTPAAITWLRAELIERDGQPALAHAHREPGWEPEEEDEAENDDDERLLPW